MLDAYVVDFIALTSRLVVEVDGEYHRTRAHYDRARDRRLAFAGYRILRLPATLVMTNMPAALALIASALQSAPQSRRSKT
jgi:leucyl-tRNA synthetase